MTPGPICNLPFGFGRFFSFHFFLPVTNYLFRETETNKVEKPKQKEKNGISGILRPS